MLERAGVVQRIKKGYAYISLDAPTSTSGSASDPIVVRVACGSRKLQINDRVSVTSQARTGALLLFWGILVPVAAFALLLGFFWRVSGVFWLAILWSIMTLGPYYSLIWLLRGRMSSLYTFRLKEE